MAKSSATQRRPALLTPSIRRLSAELIGEVCKAAVERQLCRNEAEGQLSGALADIYSECLPTIVQLPEEGEIMTLRKEETGLANRRKDWNA
jgi:hypothetical protein